MRKGGGGIVTPQGTTQLQFQKAEKKGTYSFNLLEKSRITQTAADTISSKIEAYQICNVR